MQYLRTVLCLFPIHKFNWMLRFTSSTFRGSTIVAVRLPSHRLLWALHWTFHVLQLSNLNVVVTFCFPFHRLLRALYWTFHALQVQLPNMKTLQCGVLLCSSEPQCCDMSSPSSHCILHCRGSQFITSSPKSPHFTTTSHHIA